MEEVMDPSRTLESDFMVNANRESMSSSYVIQPVTHHQASVLNHDTSKGNDEDFSSIITYYTFPFLEYVKDGYHEDKLIPSILHINITDGKIFPSGIN